MADPGTLTALLKAAAQAAKASKAAKALKAAEQAGATDKKRRKQVFVALTAGLGALVTFVVVLAALVLTVIFAPFTAAGSLLAAGWDLLTGDGGPPGEYVPMYVAAGEHYEVNPFLLAAVHKQESTFSRYAARRPGAPEPAGAAYAAVAHGWNGCGAGGPMQFGIVGVAPYNATVGQCPNSNGAGGTWNAHKNAFRPIDELRPRDEDGELDYPLNRDVLKSCREVPAKVGCVYDDFDAIAAAAHKLKADGADMSLSSEGTRQAVCAYIGSCSEVDSCRGGPNQYCEVIPQAKEWESTLESLLGDGAGVGNDPVIGGSAGELAWPTPSAHRVISSPFGPRWGRMHEGIDIRLPTGTPIYAAEGGRVTHAGWHGGYGNFVCVHRVFGNGAERSTCYAHLDRILTRAGARVGRRDVIGLGGNTGASFGSHLHFELRLGVYPAAAVDPLPCLRGEGDDPCPVKPASKEGE